jgi:hypothetical protein
MEHSMILLMMKQLGFSDSWLNWASNILGTAITSILLNGVPEKGLVCKRGVRQGDPMSPLLFVLATELLQCVINQAHSIGLLKLPIPSNEQAGFPII